MFPQGRYDAARTPGTRIDWVRTLLAKRNGPLERDHLHFMARRPGVDVVHCFVLDCSASMLEGGRLARAKGILLALFDRAARQRHRVALVGFGGAGAQRRFGPAIPRWWNERWVAPIGGGGGTPLRKGLQEAGRVLHDSARTTPGCERWLWLLTDGRSAEQPAPPTAERCVVIDFEDGPVRLGRCATLAADWQAVYLPAGAFDPAPGAPAQPGGDGYQRGV